MSPQRPQIQSKVSRRFFYNRQVVFGLFIVLFIVLVSLPRQVTAQSLYFNVPELRMEIYLQPDASAMIIYDITFSNSLAGSPIDIVDIATPHENYDLSNMSAAIGEQPIDDIRVSELIDTGVEIHLGDLTIQPGEVSTLHFEFTMPDMVYQDVTNKDLASFQIMPTPFEGAFIFGTSDVWIAVHLLPSIQPDEVLYQDIAFSQKIIFDEHTVVSWRWLDATLGNPDLVGMSFPKRGMNQVVQQSLLELTEKWLLDHPQLRLFMGIASVLLFSVIFFRFTWGTGISVFVLLTAGLIWVMSAIPLSVLLALPTMLVLLVVNERRIRSQKRRYLPAIAQVEGGGIKRGLTAPEAAIILELPLNKVLLLLVFGLLEKGICSQEADEPLTLAISPEFQGLDKLQKERRTFRRKVAQDLGIVIRRYEHSFIDKIEEFPGKPIKDLNFSKPMQGLINQTAKRLKGFDLSDTQDYYRKIIAKAMNEAKEIGDIPERERYLDRHLQWLLLDDAYPTVFSTRGYHYRPIWVRPFASSDRIGGAVPSLGSSRSAPGGKTSFSDVTASFAGWTENTMGNIATAISPGSIKFNVPAGAVNLSGADKVTGDVFKALTTSSGGGSSGGGGGGCACACAGCACACACAGGGR